MLTPWKESYDQPRQHIKKQRYHFANKGPYSQSYGFSSSHVWMLELDHKEGWVLKNRCFWTVVLEKTLESSLKSKEIKPVYLKGNQPLMLFGRTDAEAPILWILDARSWLTVKDHDAGKDWMTEEEMVGWHHGFNGYEHGQTLEMVRDWEAWSATTHGVVKSQTQLGTWTTTAWFTVDSQS